jgi:hypothetical protein
MNIFFGVHFTDEKNCRLHFKEKIFSRFLITLLNSILLIFDFN